MTVSANLPSESLVYSGPGDYPYTFNLLRDEDAYIVHIDLNELQTVLALSVDYTITRNVDNLGGTVHATYAPLDGTLLIQRKVTIDQLVDWVNNSRFDMEILERAMDKLTMIAQEQDVAITDLQTTTAFRGDWQPSTTYIVGQIVQVPEEGGSWYAANQTHNSSSGTFEDDKATFWDLILDVNGLNAAIAAAIAAADDSEDSADASAASAANALASENKAFQWAENPHNVPVDPGEFSAHHWAIEAQSFAGGGITWGTPVDAVITPDGAGTRDFGTVTNPFATGHFTDLVASTGLTTEDITVEGVVLSALIPSPDATLDLGSAPNKWRDAYISGRLQVADSGYITVGTGDALRIHGDTAGGVDLTGSPVKVNGLPVVGTQPIFIHAGSITPSTTFGCGPFLQTELTDETTPEVRGLTFEQGVSQYAQFDVRMPGAWDGGTITAVFDWTTVSTDLDDVVWGLRAHSPADGGAIDVSMVPSNQQVIDTGQGTAYAHYESPAISPLTIEGSPTPGSWVTFSVYRFGADAEDTLLADATLRGVTLFIQTTKLTDDS